MVIGGSVACKKTPSLFPHARLLPDKGMQTDFLGLLPNQRKNGKKNQQQHHGGEVGVHVQVRDALPADDVSGHDDTSERAEDSVNSVSFKKVTNLITTKIRKVLSFPLHTRHFGSCSLPAPTPASSRNLSTKTECNSWDSSDQVVKQ